mmetsp:Transcript_28304/g.91279  ORF Transcript_28304/g.91279 Transcript_28304/m.91279 type:complete len:111 (+) Transcript_28304:104-436(+)
MFRNYGATDAPEEEKKTLLEDSIAVTEEANQVGGATLEQLQIQRGQIEGAGSTASDTRSITQRAKQVMGDIQFKIFKEKVVLSFVILALLGVDAGLAYLLVKNGGSFTGK